MENASKALLIAGGVMIAILILSIVMYLVATYKEVGETHQDISLENEVKSFNSNFTKFIGREDITAQEIVTIINYCQEYEESYETAPKIEVLNASSYNISKIKRDLIEFITVSSDNNWKFACNVESVVYDDKGKVSKIIFTKSR